MVLIGKYKCRGKHVKLLRVYTARKNNPHLPYEFATGKSGGPYNRVTEEGLRAAKKIFRCSKTNLVK